MQDCVGSYKPLTPEEGIQNNHKNARSKLVIQFKILIMQLIPLFVTSPQAKSRFSKPFGGLLWSPPPVQENQAFCLYGLFTTIGAKARANFQNPITLYSIH